MLPSLDISSFVDGSLITSHLYLALTILIAAAFVAGYIDAIAGGSGLIMLPASLLVGLSPQVALGQGKLISTIGTLAAVRNYIKNNAIIWQIVPLGIICALLGSFIGAKIILLIPSNLVSILVIILLPIGLAGAIIKAKINRVEPAVIRVKWVSIIPTCLIIGFYDGFFGPGAGSLFIIALTFFNKFNMLEASATSKIFNLASNIAAFVVFAIHGNMLFILGIPMVLASLLGNHLGSLQAIKTNGNVIKKVLIFTVSASIINLIIKQFFTS